MDGQEMKKQACRMRYVSNAGVLLLAEGYGLGIDIFCRDSSGLYQDTPPEIKQELLEEIEEGRLLTLIFTHGHEDHFCREDVLEAWKRNSKLRVISTEQVVEELRQVGMADEALKAIPVERIREKPLFLELGPFQAGFLNSLHEGAQYADIQNLTLLMETGGQHLVIPGDAAPDEKLFQKIGRWSEKIDWFFAPFPYIGLRSTRNMLGRNLEIRRIFVLHQPRREADEQNWVQKAKSICERTKDELPMPMFPEELGKIYQL